MEGDKSDNIPGVQGAGLKTIIKRFPDFSEKSKILNIGDVITYASKNKDKLLVGEYLLRIGIDGSVKSEGRDIIPSPYTTGLLDKFLDGKFVPAFETSRGCPFACTFCDQGLDKTKITTFSVNRLAEEPELTNILYLTPNHSDHSFSKALTLGPFVRIGSSCCKWEITASKSSRKILLRIKGYFITIFILVVQEFLFNNH